MQRFSSQEPMNELNPVFTVRQRIVETIMRHRGRGAHDAVEIPAPFRRFVQDAHELLGGMRERAMIVLAMACKPKSLIVDEPTIALDVTVQAQTFDLLRDGPPALLPEIPDAVVFSTTATTLPLAGCAKLQAPSRPPWPRRVEPCHLLRIQMYCSTWRSRPRSSTTGGHPGRTRFWPMCSSSMTSRSSSLLRRGRGDIPGPYRRTRPPGPSVQRAAVSLHACADVRGTGQEPGAPGQPRATGLRAIRPARSIRLTAATFTDAAR